MHGGEPPRFCSGGGIRKPQASDQGAHDCVVAARGARPVAAVGVHEPRVQMSAAEATRGLPLVQACSQAALHAAHVVARGEHAASARVQVPEPLVRDLCVPHVLERVQLVPVALAAKGALETTQACAVDKLGQLTLEVLWREPP